MCGAYAPPYTLCVWRWQTPILRERVYAQQQAPGQRLFRANHGNELTLVHCHLFFLFLAARLLPRLAALVSFFDKDPRFVLFWFVELRLGALGAGASVTNFSGGAALVSPSPGDDEPGSGGETASCFLSVAVMAVWVCDESEVTLISGGSDEGLGDTLPPEEEISASGSSVRAGAGGPRVPATAVAGASCAGASKERSGIEG